jgi:NTE family protein
MGLLPWRGKRRVGLALSGGGARGFAHLGVVEVLQKAGIRLHAIAGTSAGSLVGALVAGNVPLDRVRKAMLEVSWTKLARPVLPGQRGLLSLEPLGKLLNELLEDKRLFSDLAIPFACVATDVDRDEAVLLQTGELATAVRASCTVPGVFVPVEREGRMLIDGGVTINLPVQALLDMGCDYVIAVDVLPPRETPARPSSLAEVLLVSFYALVRAASRESRLADVVVTPDIRRFGFVDFERRDELVGRGRQATEQVLERVLADLGMLPNPPVRVRVQSALAGMRSSLARWLKPVVTAWQGARRALDARLQQAVGAPPAPEALPPAREPPTRR